MKTLLTISTLILSLSSFASMDKLGSETAKNVDLKIAQQKQLVSNGMSKLGKQTALEVNNKLKQFSMQEVEGMMEQDAHEAAISTNLFFNCSVNGQEEMLKHFIKPACENALTDALDAGFTDEEIIDAVTRRHELYNYQELSPELEELEKLIKKDLKEIEGR